MAAASHHPGWEVALLGEVTRLMGWHWNANACAKASVGFLALLGVQAAQAQDIPAPSPDATQGKSQCGAPADPFADWINWRIAS